jgi:hypothetical protein
MIGLCHVCFGSGQLITINAKGLPICEHCHEKELCKCISS